MALAPAEVPGPIMDPDPLDGFIHLDEELVFTYLNPTVLQWLEERWHDGDVLVGKGLVESLSNVEDNSIVAEVQKAVRGGGPARLRRQLESDGPWHDIYVKPVENGVSVTVQDKTRLHEAESERSLRESETRFRSVVESLGEGLIITDLDDRILYVNPRPGELTGHRQEDLARRPDQTVRARGQETCSLRSSASPPERDSHLCRGHLQTYAHRHRRRNWRRGRSYRPFYSARLGAEKLRVAESIIEAP